MGRRPGAGGLRSKVSAVRLTDAEHRTLERLRGALDEATFWRYLLHAEASRRAAVEGSDTPG